MLSPHQFVTIFAQPEIDRTSGRVELLGCHHEDTADSGSTLNALATLWLF
jgi:hypothetical protein